MGDYAICDSSGNYLALIERKTFDNLKKDFSNLKVLQQKLLELEKYPYSALVIEASYAHFLDPKKTYPYTTVFCQKAIGELQARHPKIPTVFTNNRKYAETWVLNYFNSISQFHQENNPENQGYPMFS